MTMTEAASVDVGSCRIAVRHQPGKNPGVVWLGGYRSDMLGTKAEALAAFILDFRTWRLPEVTR